MPLSRVSQFRNRANVGLLALAFGVILVTSFVSVSYTHLDVYKRQPPSPPGGHVSPTP